MLPPGNSVILRTEVNGCRQKHSVDVKFASNLDFSAEALVAYPGLRPPADLHDFTDKNSSICIS